MGKPEVSGRMIKWTIEIGEFDIECRPRTSIKGQALADFLQEMMPEGDAAEWLLHVDGSSTSTGSRAGIVLTNPQGEDLEFAVKFGFKASNNEAEYEALVRGLKMALNLGVKSLIAYSDSMIVTNQVLGEFEVKEDRMRRYVSVIEGMVKNFTFFKLEQIPREENVKAGHLAKIASSADNCCNRKITILFEDASNIEMEVLEIDDGDDWRFSLFQYLSKARFPGDKRKTARVQARAMRFCIVGDLLYKKTFEGPMLRCLSEEEGRYVLREIHEGACGDHGGSRALARKTTRAGYFLPKIKEEAESLVKTCEKCQKHGSLIHHPSRLSNEFALSFFQVGYRYYNGTQFQGRKIRSWLEGMKVKQHFTAVAHPQANGQVEVTNRTLVRGIKARLDRAGGGWVDELQSVLWLYRTTPKEATGETPFSLVYGAEAVIPAEIGMETHRIQTFEETRNQELMKEALEELEEKRQKSYLRMEASKRIMKASYDKRVKRRNFQVGDLVLRRADALKSVGKLEANWEGPYKVIERTSSGSI
ncbi:hypothetical protein DH2020_030001 [Rehmannia glutinosa]|uniref:Uncharacterized protein n=1 Tax=Rehmannia glutinosa TaxID=99300 RepID=A0ABR0VR58_REHGL